MRVSVAIVAAGSGVRLGMNVPKAFVELNGRPLLSYALETAFTVAGVFEVITAVPAGTELITNELLSEMAPPVPVKVIPGGRTRQESVLCCLEVTSAEAEFIIVHDAARPNAPRYLFEECLKAAAEYGAAICAIPVSDTLKRAENNVILATVPRRGLYQAQTPQAFRAELLRSVHKRAVREGWEVTDDAELVERAGGQVRIVNGRSDNMKITTPEDLTLASILLRRAKP